MQPLFQHIYLKNDESYNLLYVDRPYFVVPWHHHPEIEIMLILSGEGSRIVGDSIEHFERGDLVMVGSNLPHCWKSGVSHFHMENKDLVQAKAYVILFKEDCFGGDFFQLPEFKFIAGLLKKAQRGIKFTGATQKLVGEKIARAYLLQGAGRFAALIEILSDLAETREFVLLSGEISKVQRTGTDIQRLNSVVDYLITNFRNEVRLEEAAAIACMSPTSFCRYFKARTNKPFTRFLNELRISHAKRLLIDTNKSISQISFDSGFTNLPNFYEQFKKITGLTPVNYKRQHVMSILSFSQDI